MKPGRGNSIRHFERWAVFRPGVETLILAVFDLLNLDMMARTEKLTNYE